MQHHLPLITASRVRAFQRCPRYHHIRYNLGYRTTERAAPLAFGSLFHRALEAWWTAADGPRIEAAIEQLDREVDSDPYDLARAQALIEGYDIRWSDAGLTPELVEATFELPLTNPQTGAASRTYRLAGKVDAIVRSGPQLWLLEHKTTSETITPGSAYWAKLRMDNQVSMYLNGAEALGRPVSGCIYDVIGKPTLRPYKATPPEVRKYKKDGSLYANQREEDETPEEYLSRLRWDISENPDRYYQRAEVVRIGDELQEFDWELWQTARAIRDAEIAERHPRNPNACFQWQRPCDYFDVCSGSASLDDVSRFVHETDPHPELQEEHQ